MISLSEIALHMSLILIIHACSSGTEVDSLPMVNAVFSNESGFTLEALFLHEEPMNYKEKTNLLMEPLQPGNSISDRVPGRPWYVTVYRQPNKDTDVLAYTTATAWDAAVYSSIIYFDEQFRVGSSP